MSESNTNCPKCSGEMEQGFIADHEGHNTLRPSDWVEGEPVKSFWSGTEIRDKEQYEVTTFRCARCGYLESYASQQSSAKNSIFG